jgi:ABC-2 type transporter.
VTRWAQLARRDYLESVRDRSFYTTIGFFTLLGAAVGVLFVQGAGDDATGTGLLALLTGAVTLLVPLVALLISYESVVGPRQSGTLKVLLGLPYTRRNVVIGAVLGRLGLTLSAVAALLFVPHAVALVGGAPVAPSQAAVLFGAAALLSMAFVGVAVGVSAAVRSTGRAAALAFGFFLLSVLLWRQVLVRGLVFVVNGFEFPGTIPRWANVVGAVNPATAYATVVGRLAPELSGAALGGAVGPPGAVHRSAAFGAVVLVAWTVLAPLVGLFAFDRTDL